MWSVLTLSQFACSVLVGPPSPSLSGGPGVPWRSPASQGLAPAQLAAADSVTSSHDLGSLHQSAVHCSLVTKSPVTLQFYFETESVVISLEVEHTITLFTLLSN